MKKLTKLAAIVAVSTFIINPAFAKEKSETPPAGTANVDTSPKPTPKPASEFSFKTISEGMKDRVFFYTFASGVMGSEWADSVGAETLPAAGAKVRSKADRKASAKILSRIPRGAKGVFEFIGKDPMDDKAFQAWLKESKCRFKKEDEFDQEIWTSGCDDLAKKLSTLVLAGIKASKASSVVKANAKLTLDKAMKLTAGDEKLAMIHLAALMLPLNEWANAFSLVDDLNVLNGKSACFLPNGEEARCGTVTAADANGVTINGETVPWDNILGDGPALGFGNIETIKSNWGKGGGSTYHSKHLVSLEGRFVLRAGWANQYDSPGMVGFMGVGRLNLHDNFSIHGGVGVGSLSGQSVFGVNEGDSSTVFMAMVGASGLLGLRSWPLVPVLEANATFQGERPGIEGGLGVEILPESPFDIRVLGTLGYYPTGRVLFTHPDKKADAFNLFAPGLAVGVGGTF